MKNICIWLLSIFVLTACSSDSTVSESGKSSKKEKEYIYGVTIDSIEDIDNIVDAIESLEQPITTRIVFDEIDAVYYSDALKKLDLHTNIMGQIFDSEYIKNFNIYAYKQRVNSYMSLYGDIVDIWEIGNELNGEWTGEPKDVVEKTLYAFREAKKQGHRTALTLYYNDFKENDGCWENPKEKMRDWAKRELNSEIKEGIDYLFVSYYEEDCHNYKPTLEEWNRVFSDLGQIFPKAKLGFGEVGTTDVLKKESYLQRYYTLNIAHPRYIGGHFWWYFREDMVPKSKKLWTTINNIIK